MRFIVTGSHAMKHHGIYRTPNDFDIIADFDSAVEYMKRNSAVNVHPINGGKTLVGIAKGGIIEASIAWPGTTSRELLDTRARIMDPYVSLNELLALKLSHRYLRNSPFFYKTMKDIKDLRAAGATLEGDEWLQDWLKRREKETYNYKHPNLDQSKQGFFAGDGVIYTYDHDSIHEAVAIIEQTPMYKRYQKDDNEVLCDKAKWDILTHYYKMIAVVEESAVLAIERSLVPFPGAKTPMEAFKFALMKVASSITSGWFREFAWENHDEILELVRINEYDFWGKFQQALKEGKVKKYESNS